jgi:hypothetical protein
MEINQILAKELNIKETQVAAAVQLMDDGNTITLLPVTARKPRAGWTIRCCVPCPSG